jgi:arylsulfatase A-like enzyme
LGDHGVFCKHTNWDQGTKTPLIIQPPLRDTGYAFRNSKSVAPVELLDVMPTLHEMCDLSVNLNVYVFFLLGSGFRRNNT